MKILVVCQHYWPEPYPLADLCEGLKDRGHEVDVLTGIPNYPMGKIYPGYGHLRRRREEHNGIPIRRCFTVARRKNVLMRFVNYYSFSFSATLKAMGLRKKYDVVFANQTSPVMMVRGALAYAKKNRVPCVLYCMDLWPACLAAGGIRETSPIYRFYEKVSARLYRQADTLLITSRMFAPVLEKLGVDQKRIAYLPQYAEARFTPRPLPRHENKVQITFAGNIGAAQSLDTVLDAAAGLKTDAPRVQFVIAGDGSELEHLKARSQKENLSNVTFLGRRPIEEMPDLYAQSDAMLISLTADPFISLTLPNKMQTYLAAARPVIASANGEISRVLEDAGCGFCAPAQDGKALADAVRKFLACEDKAALSQKARNYYEAHFTRERFLDSLEDALSRALKGAKP